MKSVTYRTANGRISCELEAASPKAAFEAIASFQEVFEEADCGKCNSANIRFDVREFDGNRYFKMVCADCHAQLDFGQNKDMVNLFPKRFDKDSKKPLPHRGWYIWEGHKDEPDQPQHVDHPTGPIDNGVVVQWRSWLEKSKPTRDQVNKNILDLKKMSQETRKAIWEPLVMKYAKDMGWAWDDQIKTFVVPFDSGPY